MSRHSTTKPLTGKSRRRKASSDGTLDMECPICGNPLWFNLVVYGCEQAIVRGDFTDWHIRLSCAERPGKTNRAYGPERRQPCGYIWRSKFELREPGLVAMIAPAMADFGVAMAARQTSGRGGVHGFSEVMSRKVKF